MSNEQKHLVVKGIQGNMLPSYGMVVYRTIVRIPIKEPV